jgi:DNA-binding beta-propeller fold protein YncE/tetratricopeptide (TPR) repeat protein
MRDKGHNVFIDVNSITIGDPWARSIEKNISECDIFVVILTPDSLSSSYVEQEVLQAQQQNKIIVPCIHQYVDYSDIKWGLQENQGIEFSDKYELALNLYPKIKNYTNKEIEESSFVSQQKIIHDKNISVDVDVLFYKGMNLYYEGKIKDATEYIDKVLEIDPNHINALFYKGLSLFGLKRSEEANKWFDKVLEIDPKHVNALNTKGVSLNILGKYEKAIECFDKVLEIDPNHGSALHSKKLALESLSKEKPSSYSNTTSKGTMPKGWKYLSSSFDKNTMDNVNPHTVSTKSDDVMIRQKDNLSQLSKEERTVAVESELYPTKDTIKKYSYTTKWRSVYLNKPTGISVNSTGYVYVSEFDNNGYIQKFDSNGNFIAKWGSKDTVDGAFSYPDGIAVDSSSGYVYVAEYGNKCIQKFDSDGTFITKWGGYGFTPRSISVDSKGNVYVVDNGNWCIQKFDSNGTFITKWGSKGNGDGEFSLAYGIAVDSSSGYVYVADGYNNRIQKFDSNGNFITKWGSFGDEDGEFAHPWGIAVDSSSGYVYVADSENDRIQKFDSNGNFIAKWGSKGNGDGQFSNPWGIFVDSSSGYVYVTDYDNHRIQVFSQ